MKKGKYSVAKLDEEVLEVRSSRVLDPGFKGRLNKLILEGKCQDEKELVDCALLRIPEVEITNRVLSTAAYTSKIYRGLNPPDTSVIIKVIEQGPQISTFNQEQRFREGFERIKKRTVHNEGVLISQLHLNNIVHKMNFGIEGDEYCWFVYYDEGQTLHEYLSYQPRLDRPVFTIKYFTSLVETLVAMHSRGLAHRDLKPDNVFVREENGKVIAILGDLETIVDVKEIEKNRASNPDYESIGNLAYMSPEGIRDFLRIKKLEEDKKKQGRKQLEIPPHFQTTEWLASDVFSVGVMMCYVITGELPGYGSAHRQLIGPYDEAYISWKTSTIGLEKGQKALSGFYESVKKSPPLIDKPELRSLVLRCLAEESQRPKMEEVHASLRNL